MIVEQKEVIAFFVELYSECGPKRFFLICVFFFMIERGTCCMSVEENVWLGADGLHDIAAAVAWHHALHTNSKRYYFALKMTSLLDY